MKKLSISILLLIVMVLAVSAVSAADIDDTSDSALEVSDEASVDDVVAEPDSDSDQEGEPALSSGGDPDPTAISGEKNFTELQSDIDAGISGGQSYFKLNDNYKKQANESDVIINAESITIDGNGKIFDANNIGGIFIVGANSKVTLINFIFINANSTDGGAIFNVGNLTIQGSTFNNNSALSAGGAIYNNGVLIIEDNCIFTDNDAKLGGAIYSDGKLTLKQSYFTNNNGNQSMAIFLDVNSDATIDDIELVNASSIANCGLATLSNFKRDEYSKISNQGTLSIESALNLIEVINYESGVLDIKDSYGDVINKGTLNVSKSMFTIENNGTVTSIEDSDVTLNNLPDGTVVSITESDLMLMHQDGTINNIDNCTFIIPLGASSIINNGTIISIANSFIDKNLTNLNNIGTIENCEFVGGTIISNPGKILFINNVTVDAVNNFINDGGNFTFGSIGLINNSTIGLVDNFRGSILEIKASTISGGEAYDTNTYSILNDGTIGVIDNVTFEAKLSNRENGTISNINATFNAIEINNAGKITSISGDFDGAYIVNTGNIAVVDSKFFNNNNKHAINNNGGMVDVSGSKFVDCKFKQGTAIYSNYNGVVNIEGSEFSGISGSGFSVTTSAVEMRNGNLTVKNTRFINMKKSGWTNGIYSQSSNLTVDGCEFANLTGATVCSSIYIYSTDAVADIIDCVFNNTKATTNGAIYLNSFGAYTIEGCTFNNNTCGSNGANVIYNGNGNLTLIDNTIIDPTGRDILNNGVAAFVTNVVLTVTNNDTLFNYLTPVTLTATLTDDSGNSIKDLSAFTFVVNGTEIEGTITYDDATGVYSLEFTPSDYAAKNITDADQIVTVNVADKYANATVTVTDGTLKTVKGTFTELQYLVDNNLATTLDHNITYNEAIDGNLTTILVNNDVTIAGVNVTITGSGAPIFFVNATTTLEGLTLKGSNRAAVIVNGTLTLNNNTINKEATAIVVIEGGYISNANITVLVNGEALFTESFNNDVDLTATIVDDNGNLIKWSGLVFVVDGTPIETDYDNVTYTATYSLNDTSDIGRLLDVELSATCNIAQINVTKYETEIDVPAETVEIAYGDNGTVWVQISGVINDTGAIGYLNDTEFTITFRGTTITVKTDESGTYFYNVTVADYQDEGTYNVVVDYAGDAYNAPQQAIANIHVADRAIVTIAPHNLTINWTETASFTYNVTAGGNLIPYVNITVYINDDEFINEISADGTGAFNITDLAAGTYTVKVELIKSLTGEYIKAYDQIVLAVEQLPTILNVTSAGDVAEDKNVTITINTNIAGEYTIYDNTTEIMTIDLAAGETTLDNITLPCGDHTIFVEYAGLGNYSYAIANATVKVKHIPVIQVAADNVKVGENATVKVTVDVYGNYTITIGDLTDQLNFNETLSLSKDYELPAGKYNVVVAYAETADYAAAVNNATVFEVVKHEAEFNMTVINASIVYPDDILVNVTAVTAGNYTVAVGDKSETKELAANETYQFVISAVEVGKYLGINTVNVTYLANDIFDAKSKYGVVLISKGNITNMTVAADPVTYGEDVLVNVDVGDANGQVSITIGTSTYTEKLVDGKATITISNLDAGVIPATVEFTSDNYNDYAKDVNITVNKATPVITVLSAEDVMYPDDVVVNIVATVAGNYTIAVGNATQEVALEAYKFTQVTFANLAAGSYDVVASIAESANYNAANATANVTVDKLTSLVEIDDVTEEIAYPGEVNITYFEAYGVATIVVLDDNLDEVPFTVANNTIYLTGLNAGDYTVIAYINDTENITGSSDSILFTVDQAESVVAIIPVTEDVVYPGEVNITYMEYNGIAEISVLDENGDEVPFTVADNTIYLTGLAAGKYYIIAEINETDNIKGDYDEYTLTVEKATPTFTSTPSENNTVGDDVIIIVETNEDATGTVWLMVDGELFGTEDLVYGIAVFSVPGLEAGHHSYDVTYEGDANYAGPNSDVNSFDVVKSNATGNVTIDVNIPENSTDTVFSVNLPEDATGYLLVDVDGKNYYAPVENGTASVTVPALVPGNYTATVTYSGDDKYDSVSKTTNVTVPSNVPDSALTIPETSETTSPTYSVNLPSDATGFLIVDVDGTQYVAALNNGSASVTVPNVSEGKHNVTVTYTGDSKYSAVIKDTTLDVHVPVYKLSGKDVSVVYSAKGTYKVLVTKDGVAVGAGVAVTIKFNGKTKTVKTDAKGYATYKFTAKLKVKKYTITATYNNGKASNKVAVKHVINAKNAKIKKSKKVNKIKVKTKKVNGKYLKGKKLTLKIKGKKLKAKINKKGVATFKLKKSVTKKLKKGKKYKYTVTYGKDKVTKKITVKK